MRLRIAGMTDVGRSRDNNEDNFLVSDSEPICVVADGMGGHNSGEVASGLTLATIRAYYEATRDSMDLDGEWRTALPPWPFKRRPPEHREERRIVQAVMLANDVVHRRSTQGEDLRGMGTTVVGAYFLDAGLYLAHVGDSRAYRLRGDVLEQLTADHSLAEEYVRVGILRREDVDSFPYRNVITRAIGLAEHVEPEVRFISMMPGDTYLFCSDGLTDALTDDEIRGVLRECGADIDRACSRLIEHANHAGGPDNITVAIAHARARD